MAIILGSVLVLMAAFGPDEQMRNNLSFGLGCIVVGLVMGGWKMFRPKARVYNVQRLR